MRHCDRHGRGADGVRGYESWTQSPATNIKTAKLTVGDKNWTFPIYNGTIGPDVIDIRKLYAETGMFTYDPGFTSTGGLQVQDHLHRRRRGRCCCTAATRSSSWPSTCDFLEICYLLLNGELPNAAQKAEFDYRVTHHTMVHEQMTSSSYAASAATRTRWR